MKDAPVNDRSGLPATDVHQHLWPAELVDALRARREPPYLRGWELVLDGEPPYSVAPADHDVERRAGADPTLARVLVSLSSPLGIEDLPPDEAEPLLLAWHKGVTALPAGYGAWAAVTRTDPDLIGLAELLTGDFDGLQVPATWLASPGGLERLAPVLRVAERSDRPVLVHPGPARRTGAETDGLPGWWPAVVDYVGQLHAAWWSWQVAGRSLLPELRICFVAGAGLAPLHHERHAARGGRSGPLDSRVFVDSSSYARQGLDALIRVLGVDALVLGSDRPYAEPTDPVLGAAMTHALRVANPHRLLTGEHRA